MGVNNSKRRVRIIRVYPCGWARERGPSVFIHPENGEAFELPCVVRRGVRAPVPGIGVGFQSLAPARRRALHEFVSSVVPALVIEHVDA